MQGFLKNKHHVLDPTWHVQVATLVAIILQLVLPNRFLVAPRYFIPVIEVLLLVALSFTTPKERIFKSITRRVNVFLLIAITSIANGYALAVVAGQLLQGSRAATNGKALILAAQTNANGSKNTNRIFFSRNIRMKATSTRNGSRRLRITFTFLLPTPWSSAQPIQCH